MQKEMKFCQSYGMPLSCDEVNKMLPEPMTTEQYKVMMRGYFPLLKRWRK